MINAIRLIQETVAKLRAEKKISTQELCMLLDIYNSALLTPELLNRDTLDSQVRDSFDLYPGVYEEKWGVKKEEVLAKIAQLTNWQAYCLQIWACDFWESGCYEEPDSIKLYVQGKLNVEKKLIEAQKIIQEAEKLCEQFKGTGVKSKLIAQAQERCRVAKEELAKMIF